MQKMIHKHLMDFELTEKTQWSKSALLKFRSTQSLPEIYPGQFVQVLIENAPNTYLRRPFSIHNVLPEQNEIWLLIQKVGAGSARLVDMPIHTMVNMMIPLGNPYTIPPETAQDKTALLIGGGIGLAPLLYLGKCLKGNGFSPTFLLGGRSMEDILQLEHFQSIGSVYITTQDGSLGEKALVTEHSVLSKNKFERIYCCGPLPMMKAVAAYARKHQLWCEVSLENKMACGLGACLCCVEKTQEGHLCVCTEGPVFNINRLTW